MGLASLLFGEQKKPYSQFVKDSWAQVRQEDERSLMHLRMPKPEARLGADHKQSPTYGRENKRANDKYDKRKAEVEENNSPTQRWKRKIDHMMATGNPDLQEIAMNNLLGRQQSAEQTKARDKREYANRGKSGVKLSKVGVAGDPSMGQMGYMDENNQWQNVGPKFRNLNQAAAIAKSNYVRDTPEGPEKDAAMARLYPDYKNTGTHWVNPITGDSIPINNAGKEFQKKQGMTEQQKVADYGEGVYAAEEAYDSMTNVLADLNHLGGITDWTNTGLASWTGFVPGTPAADWKNRALGIQASLGLNSMLKLKRESSTGSTGLGAVNVKELESLQDDLGRLSAADSPAVATSMIKKIYGRVKRIQGKIAKSQLRKANEYGALYDTHKADINVPKYDVQGVLDNPRWQEGHVPDLLKGNSQNQNQDQSNTPKVRKNGDTWEDDNYYYRQTANGPERSPK